MIERIWFVLNPDKCSFAKESMQFLGHNVDKRGLLIPESKKKAIADYKRPSTAQELERFLGLFAFIHRFIPRASTLTAELNKLRPLPPAKFRNSWSKIHDDAFEDIKKAVLSSGLLYYPLPDAKMELWTDASDIAAGAVLVQWVDNTYRPISFWSKSFNKPQRKYSTFDRELLALSMACRHFKEYLESQEVVAKTDHKPLVHALKCQGD